MIYYRVSKIVSIIHFIVYIVSRKTTKNTNKNKDNLSWKMRDIMMQCNGCNSWPKFMFNASKQRDAFSGFSFFFKLLLLIENLKKFPKAYWEKEIRLWSHFRGNHSKIYRPECLMGRLSSSVVDNWYCSPEKYTESTVTIRRRKFVYDIVSVWFTNLNMRNSKS